jgi:hypothetical protein
MAFILRRFAQPMFPKQQPNDDAKLKCKDA